MSVKVPFNYYEDYRGHRSRTRQRQSGAPLTPISIR
jgi:hypothetical protein